jgi:hypothetical protein
MALKSFEQHQESLQDGREVYFILRDYEVERCLVLAKKAAHLED